MSINIIGGGIIGLSLAWELAKAEVRVRVFDKGDFGQEASHAAAGMLAPQLEAEAGEEALLPLLLRGKAAWPEYAKALQVASGIDVGYRDGGMIMAAYSHDDARRVQRHQQYLAKHGVRLEWLHQEALRDKEPCLSPRCVGGLYSPDDHQVDNRAVVQALLAILRQNPHVTLHPQTAITALHQGGVGVDAGQMPYPCDAVVVATGAWPHSLEGLPEKLPLRPVKGQMLMVQAPLDLMQHTIWGEKVYIVPRRDGRVLIGATIEEQGYNKDVTLGGLMELMRDAWQLVPSLYDCPVLETWAGLRPSPLDDAPILGCSSREGIYYATGHHRNGVLLAPLTAQMLTALILHDKKDSAIIPFSYTRFHGIQLVC